MPKLLGKIKDFFKNRCICKPKKEEGSKAGQKSGEKK